MRIPSNWLRWLTLFSIVLGLIQPLTAMADTSSPEQPDQPQAVECPTNAVNVVVNFPAQLTDWDETQTVTAPAGKIISVNINASTQITSSMKSEHTGGGKVTLVATVSSDVIMTIGASQLSLSPLKQAGSKEVLPFDGNIDFAGDSGHDFGTATAADQKNGVNRKNALVFQLKYIE